MTLRGFVLVLALLIPSAALAGPVTLGGGIWSSTSPHSDSATGAQAVTYLPFWAGVSWDGQFMGVGDLLNAYNTEGIEYLNDGHGGYAPFRFDDEVLNTTKIFGVTAWTHGIFGRRADGAFTYDSGTGRVSNSVDNPEQYALFRIVEGATTRYFLGIEDILLSEVLNDKDYNDYGVAFQTATVPEPGTLLLLGSGFAALAMRKRRAASKSQAPSVA